MKNNIVNKVMVLALFVSGIMVIQSCDKTPYGQDFDLSYPTPNVTSIITTGEISTGLTLLGTNLDKVLDIRLNGVTILDTLFLVQTATEIVATLPRTYATGTFTLDNIYRRTFTSSTVISPVYPNTSITGWPTSLVVGDTVFINGTNMDLISQLDISGNKVAVTGGSLSTITLPIPSTLVLGDSAVITVTKSLSVIAGSTTSPKLPVTH